MASFDGTLTPWQRATLDSFAAQAPALRERWKAAPVFPHLFVDDFLPSEFAEGIFAAYPPPDEANWDKTTYTHQRKKFTKTSGFPPAIQQFFDLTAHREFRDLLTEVTTIPALLDDPELVGGGLHQILRDGFLDVHVDFNFHPRTKQHRRLNLLLYMNKDWRPEYEGRLELWDMQTNRQLENLVPSFNRIVLFQTNEVSYHGHPRPLACPQHLTRKSLAVYYYTDALEIEAAPEHNTLYRQTSGARGYLKTAVSSLDASVERVRGKGGARLVEMIAKKVMRRIRGKPPENA